MFEDLNAVLNYDASAPPAQGLTLIKCAAPTSEGALLVHHFVSLYLQAGCPVCLCAFEQDLAHYAAVSKKMGVNLTAEAAAGRFVFVDGFSNPYAGPADVEAGGDRRSRTGAEEAVCAARQAAGEEVIGPQVRFSIDTQAPLRTAVLRFLELLWSTCASLNSTTPSAGDHDGSADCGRKDIGGSRRSCCVVIDSLQTFFDASEGDGEGEGDAALLVQYLASLAADASLPCAVVVLAQSQPAPCPAAEPATTLAQYMAKLVLEVGPLQSGHSSAVHGQVVMYVLHTHTHTCMHACMQTNVLSRHSSAVHGQGVRASRGCPMHTSNVLSTGTMLQRCDKLYTHVCMHQSM